MHEIPLHDPSDPRLDDYSDLTDTALRTRREVAGGLYIAESLKVIERAVGAGHRPRSVLTQERWLPGIRALLAGTGTPVYVAPDTVVEAVAGFPVHRGAMAAMHRPAEPSVAEVVAGARTVLILEGLIEHANVGSGFRAAAALGADAVLVSARCADPLYRRSVRVSMGTVFQVPWTRFADWTTLSAALRDERITVAALALRDDATTLDAFAATRPDRVALAFGSEGPGLTAEALDAADAVVTIPMAGGVDSLNVGSTVAVALWALQHPPASA
ncbi:RNA methyltransferase [Microbacterium capsulatum]|uniref:RNA methyltransferase n=1 Tax=Microbacterium capsulatum TaxID=3041921 RepID=A0ABU0XE10_9MICO|nr:RNA methyltransferase [Microbacterium sp. ASV81]MDQ4213355.1 RNA methyltransferase [Microbacterium sp. ASV81]